jgi:small conductance mechanosensitive channel
MNMDFGTAQPYVDTAFELGMSYIPKLLLALITLIVGFWLIHRLTVGMNKLLSLRSVEATLSKFLVHFVNILLKALLIISVAGMVGIETTSFIAMLGAIGLGVGMALQGSLGNLAGGILILFFKPYRVDDVIEVQGHTGRVREIHIFNTILITYDNQKIIIPNGTISNGCIKNLFSEPTRRVDITFGVSYGDDIRHVKQVLRDVIDADPRILQEPSYDILVSAHADSAIEITTRTWVATNDFWPVHFALYENVKIAFDQANITIPFPQRDVHMSHNQ